MLSLPARTHALLQGLSYLQKQRTVLGYHLGQIVALLRSVGALLGAALSGKT